MERGEFPATAVQRTFSTTQYSEEGGPGWTGRVSVNAVSSPWGGRCWRKQNCKVCFRSVPTLYCAGLFTQKDKKHTLWGRVRRLGEGMGTGVSAPEEAIRSKSEQVDMPLGTGAGFRLICLIVRPEMQGWENPRPLLLTGHRTRLVRTDLRLQVPIPQQA